VGFESVGPGAGVFDTAITMTTTRATTATAAIIAVTIQAVRAEFLPVLLAE
jgi:hypothetical protein